MSDLFFATPWWFPTCIIGVGIVLFFSGNKRQMNGVRNAGLIAVLMAIILIVISFLVVTDKEKVARHTRQLIADIEGRNWTDAKTLISPQVSLVTLQTTVYPNRDTLLKGAQACVDEYHLSAVHITSLEVTQTDTIITANLNVWTEQDITQGRPVPSGWQLNWEQNGKDWILNQITCVSIANERVSDLAGRFAK